MELFGFSTIVRHNVDEINQLRVWS